MHSPGTARGNRPARQQLALAPPQWAVPAAPPRPRRGRSRRIALLAVAACGLAAIARAQDAPGGGGGGDTGGATAPAGGGAPAGGAPAGGAAAVAPAAPDAAPGSLRAQIEGVLPGANAAPAGPTTAPAWIVTPGLSLQEQWTDNTFQTPSNRQSSLITQVSPSVSVTGSTARLQADLYYAPSAELYVPQSSQNQIGQNLGTDALLTLSPEQLYIKTTGYASVQSAFAGAAPNGAVALPQAGEVQTYNFSVEPYLTQRFGGWGALQVGASAGETSIDALGNGGGSQSLNSGQVFATFKSGENFGRLSSTVQLSSTQNTGTGALQGSNEQLANYQAGYAITRDVIALGSIGWEDIRYTGFGAPHYDDATWSVGAQLTPNPDSSIVVSYGHQQGATSASVNASYAPTARLRLFAQYSDGVTSAAQSLSNALVRRHVQRAGPADQPDDQPAAVPVQQLLRLQRRHLPVEEPDDQRLAAVAARRLPGVAAAADRDPGRQLLGRGRAGHHRQPGAAGRARCDQRHLRLVQLGARPEPGAEHQPVRAVQACCTTRRRCR